MIPLWEFIAGRVIEVVAILSMVIPFIQYLMKRTKNKNVKVPPALVKIIDEAIVVADKIVKEGSRLRDKLLGNETVEKEEVGEPNLDSTPSKPSQPPLSSSTQESVETEPVSSIVKKMRRLEELKKQLGEENED